MVKVKQGMKIFSGNANPALAREICERMGTTPGNAVVTQFGDGEINVQIVDNVRGSDVFVVHPTSMPVNRADPSLPARRGKAQRRQVVAHSCNPCPLLGEGGAPARQSSGSWNPGL